MLDLDAIEAAEKAMTPAPWRRDDADLWHEGVAYNDAIDPHLYLGIGADTALSGGDVGPMIPNLDGIALLRNAAPAMIARIREQDAEIERLERQLELECGERREKDIAAACDHLHETTHRLRALCGEAVEEIAGLCRSGADSGEGTYDLADRLRAASKGEA